MSEVFARVSASMEELLAGFYPQAIVGDINIGFTIYIFWLALAVALMLVIIFGYRRRMQNTLVPHGAFVNGVEYVVEYVRDDVCKGTLGDSWREHFPFLATVFFFVMFGNYVGMLPTWKPGTGSTGITGAVALASFVYFIYVGMRKKGVFGYIKSLAPKGLPAPIALLVWVIEVFSTLLRPITLAIRLFCNMFAGHMVMGVFALMCTFSVQPLLEQFVLPNLGVASTSILWMVLLVLIYVVELLVCFIQAYIFTLLSAVYIQLAEADEH